MGTSPQHPMHLPSVCCNASVPAMHVCLQCMCACNASEQELLHPCCSTGVPSARSSQVPGRPPRDRRTRRTRAGGQARRARAASSHDEARRDARARKHDHDSHVPSAKACQVPRRAKCQGAAGRHDGTQHESNATAADPLARRGRTKIHGGRGARAKCQGVPSARASQVPGRLRGRLGEGDAGIGQAGLGRARAGPCIGGEGVSCGVVCLACCGGWARAGPRRGVGFMGTGAADFLLDILSMSAAAPL